MLPRRCKKCRCYVAPHLKKCPRCGTVAPDVASKPTKEEKQAIRKTQDAKVPTIQGKHIHWIPSVFSLKAHADKLKNLGRLLERADSARTRNALRSEIRQTKAHLARKTVPTGKKGWTTESLHVKHSYVTVFISPKKHRYVMAERDKPADLLVIPKKDHGLGPLRLQRLEKSAHMRALKKLKQEEVQHTQRKKVKKARRATVRQHKQASS